MNYDLGILNDKEFEDLCQSLIEKDLGIKFQNFKKGKDGGIDLRYACDIENQIIVQSKHFIKSKFSVLKSHIKNIERKKLALMQPKPSRYILMTSVPLNPRETDQLVNLLNPYVKSSQDIYGLDRICSLLSDSKEIEEKFFKLWLTSTNILKRIVNNAVKGRSEFYEQKILRKLSLYVPTQNFEEATKKLKENSFIIVAGEPGIGKTTISYLLICDLLANNYELIYIADKIKDAEDALSPDPDKCQVIFFDDFLGSNLYEIINPRNSESTIVGLIERIQILKNKFLILTTRTTILNQANSRLEKLSRSKLVDISKYEVVVSNYSRLDRARILYNHLYHSDIPSKFQDTFFEDKNYYKIIDHENYSPRLIEFFTSNRNLTEVVKKDFKDFIFDNLENPHQIWRNAFENQLDDEDRFFLGSLFTLGGYSVNGVLLEKAFEARLKFEIENNGFKRNIDSFNSAIRKLLDGFVRSERNVETGENKFSFINPSVGDFLLNYLDGRKSEKLRVYKSAIFFEQFSHYVIPTFFGHLTFADDELEELYSHYLSILEKLTFTSTNLTLSKELKILTLGCKLFANNVDEGFIVEWLNKIDINKIAKEQFDDLLDVLQFIWRYDVCVERIRESWEDLILHLFAIARYQSDLEQIFGLFNYYDENLDEFLSEEKVRLIVINHVNDWFTKTIEDDCDFSDITVDSVLEAESTGTRYDSIGIVEDEAFEKHSDFLNDLGLSNFQDMFSDRLEIDGDWMVEKIVEDSSYDFDDYEPKIKSGEIVVDERKEIDRLFDR